MRGTIAVFCSICMVAVWFANYCFGAAFDWKRLHERADQITLQEALSDAQRQPVAFESLYTLALVYLNQYNVTEADRIFDKILSGDSANIAALWGKAEVLRRRHQPQKAQEILEKIIKEDPDFSPASITLGYMLFDEKQYQRSIQLALRVIRQGRENVDLTNYVRAYLTVGGAKGRLADSGGPFSKLINGTQILPYLKKAETLKPDYVGVLFGLGSFYAMAPSIVGGDREKGLRYLEKALKVDPLFVNTYGRLAQVWKKWGDDEKSQMYLKKALELDPQNELALRVKKERV